MSLPLPPQGNEVPPEVDPLATEAQVPVDPSTGGLEGPEAENPAAPEGTDEEVLEEDEEEPLGDPDAMRQMVVQAARQQIGVPSVAGGGSEDGPSVAPNGDDDKDPVGWDNGGLVQYALAQAGIDAPRLTEDQVDLGERVPIMALAPGDLVVFGDGEHCGIYTERGDMIDALDGEEVDEHDIDESKSPWGVSLEALYARGM